MLLGGVHPPAVPKGSSILGKGSLFERSAEEATPPAFGSAVAAAAAAVLESPSTDEAEPPAKKVKFAEDLAPVAAMAAGLKQVIDAMHPGVLCTWLARETE